MLARDNMPQWLREVMIRGFKPTKVYHDFDHSLFGYIDPGSCIIKSTSDKKVFVMEGIPGVGKTTILKYFGRDINILTVEQILPAEPEFDQAMPMSFYFRSDELKTAKCFGSDKSLCLLDRYYASTLAFYWASDKLKGTAKYNQAIRWYYRSLGTGKIVKPFAVIHIDVPLVLSFSRKGRQSEKNFNNLWRNEKFLDYFKRYYDLFYAEIEPQTKIIRLSGQQSLNGIIKEIKFLFYGRRK